jgi:hypothetical protein
VHAHDAWRDTARTFRQKCALLHVAGTVSSAEYRFGAQRDRAPDLQFVLCRLVIRVVV